MNPAIVISAYNRPHALGRLLGALARAEYPRQVPLVISIDRGAGGPDAQVAELAEQFHWPFGPKRVICQPSHLGLVDHVFFCGALSQEYGAVVFLEDDLGVSPVFYRYAAQAIAFYGDDPRIAGLSLYGLWFNGYTREPFVPWADGSDVFFVQAPYTQGQAWTASQWRRFAEWRAAGARRLSLADPVHDMFLHFDAADWFPLMTKYVVETGQFYVYPRVSLVNGAGDIGTHFSRPTAFLQVPLLQDKDSFTFRSLADSIPVYDSFFEILPDRLNRLTGSLRGLAYNVDLYATKRPRHLGAAYTLTSRRGRAPLASYAKRMWPQEANLVEPAPGTDILLCSTADLRWDRWAEVETKKINHDYFTRGQRLGLKTRLQFALVDWMAKR